MTAEHNRSPDGRTRSDAELQALLQDYLFLEFGTDAHQVAFDAVVDLLLDAPEDLWRFVCLAAEMDLSTEQAAFFAAGPVEDLLGRYGAAFIDRIEGEARRTPRMRTFLAGVWRGGMSKEVWARLLALRETLKIDPF